MTIIDYEIKKKAPKPKAIDIDYTSEFIGDNNKYYDKDGNELNPNLALLVKKVHLHDTIVLQGGTRSGKTYSVIKWIVDNMISFGKVIYGVVRQSGPTLESTVIKDFIEIATNAGIYDDRYYNKQRREFKYNGNTLTFLSGEDEGKLRGFKSDIIYLNEAPELDWLSVNQLLMRNTRLVIFDYNPSYPSSWIYDRILTKPNIAFLKTTYKDNPFLSQKILDNLEHMRLTDPEQYKIYGEGERATLQGAVYNNFRRANHDEQDLFFSHKEHMKVFSVDFGYYPDPTSVVRIGINPSSLRDVHVSQVIYENYLDHIHIKIALILSGYRDNKDHIIIADGENPRMIANLRRNFAYNPVDILEALRELKIISVDTEDILLSYYNESTRVFDVPNEETVPIDVFGFGNNNHLQFSDINHLISFINEHLGQDYNIYTSDRRHGAVKSGIGVVKRHNIIVDMSTESDIIMNEKDNYIYKKDRKTGLATGEPIDNFNHSMDCIRQALMKKGTIWD